MNNQKSLIFIVALTFLLTSCSIFKKNNSGKIDKKIDKIFVGHKDSKELLFAKSALLKIDNNLIDSDIHNSLSKLDIPKIKEIKILSNYKTVEDYSSKIRYDLIVISTSGTTVSQIDSLNGYQFLQNGFSNIKAKVENWATQLSDVYVIINGRPFLYQSDFKPFLENLSSSDIDQISILKEQTAISLYKQKYVLLISTRKSTNFH